MHEYVVGNIVCVKIIDSKVDSKIIFIAEVKECYPRQYYEFLVKPTRIICNNGKFFRPSILESVLIRRNEIVLEDPETIMKDLL